MKVEDGDLCTQLGNDFDNNNICDALQQRYNVGETCTYVGDILLSVNPCGSATTHNNNNTNKPTSHLSSRIHRALEVNAESQCVIVSGESGSGKTTLCTNIVGQFLRCCQTSHRKIRDTIEIADSIVNVFGSARCASGKNSTRYAKLLQMHFSPEKVRRQFSAFLMHFIKLIPGH